MEDVDCVIVGAGISGLITARHLADAGVSAMVFDKGRSVGGHLATRRIGEARLDHGLQFDGSLSRLLHSRRLAAARSRRHLVSRVRER